MDISKAHLLTHANCMDGTVSAILFLYAGGKRENITFSSPDHETVDEIAVELCERI